MKQTGRKIISLLLAALFLLSGSCLVALAEPDNGAATAGTAEETQAAPVKENEITVPDGVTRPELKCPYALCYDLEYEEFLLEKGTKEIIAPASFTKLMTALLAYEYRQEKGNVPVTVTGEMLSGASGTNMWLKAGEEMDFDSLLTGMVLFGANDATLAIASTVGGNVTAFVEMMNARAQELGMENTYYSNPTGVDSAMMHTTLYDTFLLCKTLYRVNDFMALSSQDKATIPATNLNEERILTNHNALIPYKKGRDYMVKGARGLVAGHTAMGGYVCATCRTTNTATAFVLVAGGTDQSEKKDGTDISSYRDAATILNWTREQFRVVEVIRKEAILCEMKVRLSGGLDHTVLVAGSTLRVLLPTFVDPGQDIHMEFHTDGDTLDAPILKGAKHGEAELYWGGRYLGKVDMVAQANVSQSPFLMLWDNVVRFFSTGPAHIFFIIVVASAVLYLLILVLTVYFQYLRNTRDKRRVVREMEERENRRLRELRKTERKQTQRNLRRARAAVREGYRVISGQSDALGAGKGVARVPEKYRHSDRPAPQNTSRRTAPAGARAQRNTQPAQTRQRAGNATRSVSPQNRGTSRNRSTRQRPY